MFTAKKLTFLFPEKIKIKFISENWEDSREIFHMGRILSRNFWVKFIREVGGRFV